MKSMFYSQKLIVCFISLLVLASCSNYGKKVTFDGNKGEVYYKGNGVTETDAKAVGKFLEEQQFFLKDDKKRSVQITKDSNRIKARFVIDEKGYAALANADNGFAVLGALMSKEVFNNTPVDIIYTNEVFKDKKTIVFNPAVLEEVNVAAEIKQMQKKTYKNNSLYYGKDINEEEADTLVKYFVRNGFFTDSGNNDLILTKTTDNAAHFRFPVKASFANEEGLKMVDDFAKQIKKDLFADVPLQFEVMDDHMVHMKTFSY